MKHTLNESQPIAVFALLLTLFAAGPVMAAGQDAPSTDRIVRGTFTTEGGTELLFSIPEGRSLFLQSQDGTRFFKVTPRVTGPRAVRLTVEEFADPDRLIPLGRQSLSLSLDGKARTTERLPFGIALNGITVEANVPDTGLGQKAAGEVTPQAECCINCDGWRVCCEPSAGWCCELECTSTGETCSACTPAVE